jgi:hypothetical protein
LIFISLIEPFLIIVVIPAISLRSENVHEVPISIMGQLILSGGERAIRVEKMGNGILRGSFDDRLMEEIGISVRPVLFVPLSVVSFYFGK